MKMHVELRTTRGNTLAEGTFKVTEPDYPQGDFLDAACKLYGHVYPASGGWSVGLRTHYPGGNTHHIQFAHRGRNRNNAPSGISLEPTVVARYDIIEE